MTMLPSFSSIAELLLTIVAVVVPVYAADIAHKWIGLRTGRSNLPRTNWHCALFMIVLGAAFASTYWLPASMRVTGLLSAWIGIQLADVAGHAFFGPRSTLTQQK